ncbi:MAG TPA: ATP-binding protein [Gemmatimonadaceae bacterium]|nr:ATP-binding protein [Gemmatimonadaceae bacterium]
MAPLARLPQAGSPRPASACLAALADIASCLATGEGLDDVIPGVLDRVREVLSADEVAVWLGAAADFRRAWAVGEPSMEAAQVLALLEQPYAGDGGVATAPLAGVGGALGAVAVRGPRALSHDERVLLTTLGNLLAPAIMHAEHAQELEEEVALRTMQIDEQRRFTERIIDSLPVGLYVIDRDYRIQAWNRKRETGMQGVSREEAIGRTIFEILHRQPAEMLRREFDDVLQTGAIQQFQMESSASGDLRTYRISKIPMRLDDVSVTHVITIGEDVTEWKQAEERFAQSEKLAAIGQLAAGVMHEINNPLATIAACAESLVLRLEELTAAGVTLPPEADDYLKIVDKEVHRCKRIVDGLLEFSRPRPSEKSDVDVNEVIEQTLFLLKHHSRFKKLGVHTELDGRIGPAVRGNPEQLIQVFMALLINAMDAMGDRGRVSIRTRRDGRSVVAEITDEGHGIKRSDMSKIFEPFFTTKPPGRGTGLGLSICYSIVAEHGGRIEVDSKPQRGSTFRILLPAGEGK